MAEVFSYKISYKNNNALAQNIKVITKLFSPEHLRENYLSLIVRKIRDRTNCQCVGIRVVSNDGLVPYEA